MKKFLLVCSFLIVAISIFADEIRRVAILETVDKMGNVVYATKLMLRSSLAKAITNTSGYEAYDRTDMDAILGEQNFQRTGMVSNDQIKRLGEMTGAKYVLVAEAAVVDANNIYITAKLLDVESARTIITDYQLMGNTAKGIQRGCQLLAEKIIRPDDSFSTIISPNVKSAKQETTGPTKPETPIIIPSQNEQLMFTDPNTSNRGKIIKISKKEYLLEGTTMDREEYQNFIYHNCPKAWEKHCQAKSITSAGWCVFSVGMLATTLASINAGLLFTSGGGTGWEPIYAASIIGGAGVVATFFVGIPLLSIGYKRMNNTYTVYNTHCVSSTSATNTLSLNLQANQNGLGVALHF